MIPLTNSIYNEQVIANNASHSLVFVWASWCSNCKRQKPILEQLATDTSLNIIFYSLKADDEQALVKELKVMAVPTILLFSHGFLVNKLTGVKSDKLLIPKIEKAVKFSIEEAEQNQYKGWLSRLFNR
jgi:thioredoxin-like negative regulator of GroEL